MGVSGSVFSRFPWLAFLPLSRRLCVCIVVNVGNGVALSVLMGTTYHMLGTNLSLVLYTYIWVTISRINPQNVLNVSQKATLYSFYNNTEENSCYIGNGMIKHCGHNV